MYGGALWAIRNVKYVAQKDLPFGQFLVIEPSTMPIPIIISLISAPSWK